ncbi:MAG: hypothetical protein OHK0039_09780 [Bacteroidia bacterium]
MIRYLAIAYTICLGAGCVQQGKYDQLVQSRDSIRHELQLEMLLNDQLQSYIDYVLANPGGEALTRRVRRVNDLAMNDFQEGGATLRLHPGQDSLVRRAPLLVQERQMEATYYRWQGFLLFAAGSSALSASAQDTLAVLAALVRDLEQHVVLIEGHTDNSETDSLGFDDWELSQRRAATAARELERLGVPGARILAGGRGRHRRIDSNQTPSGRALNRRIDLLILPANLLP